MGPRALRATSRKAATELPETARANFLTAAAQLVSVSLPQLSAHLGQQALQVRVFLLLSAACCYWHGLSQPSQHLTLNPACCYFLCSTWTRSRCCCRPSRPAPSCARSAAVPSTRRPVEMCT